MAGRTPGGIVGAVSPARGAEAITYDTAVTNGVCRALYVGAAGNVSVVMADGETVVFTAVNAGSVLPIQVRQVTTANTTVAAAVLIALY